MNPRNPSPGGLVYSTASGRMCPSCRHPIIACTCKAKPGNVGQGDGIVRVGRETKGRGGKAVTVIRGVPLDAVGLADLGKRLRAACGSGCTLKAGVLEVQGDHVERLTEMLKAQGWTVKRTGG